jgi:SPP1 gp7 family putative phage head morphogenesis protein
VIELRTAAGQACLMAFDRTMPEAIDWARTRGSMLVTSVTAETRDGIRRAIARALEEGIAPREAARIIKDIVGLRPDQVDAVLNARQRLLDAEVRATRTGRAVSVKIPGAPNGSLKVPPGGLAQERLQATLKRYSERQLRQRALLIARTETIAASNAGQQLQWEQAVRDGLLRGTEQQRWSTARDERTCPICRPLDGVTVPLGAPFPSRNGPLKAPPAHPNCRCSVVLAVAPRERRR